jgi:two-component system KDP operon response regulator KdpE
MENKTHAAEKKVLAIDDDPVFLRLIEQVLTPKGYEVLKAADGQEGLRLLFAQKPDIVLLDVVMPKMDGWQTCQRIRDISDIPIIMLTGKQNAEEDIVRGLDYGADEYLLKPVGNQELLARVRAALRRVDLPSPAETKTEVAYADDFLTVNVAERKVMVNGERVKLTPREFRLFALLVENADRILTHKQVLEKVWGWEYTDDLDYVRIYISHLRQKIEPDPTLPKYIITEPGVGYCFQKVGAN